MLLFRQKDNPVENHSLELSFIKTIPSTGFYCMFFENHTLFLITFLIKYKKREFPIFENSLQFFKQI